MVSGVRLLNQGEAVMENAKTNLRDWKKKTEAGRKLKQGSTGSWGEEVEKIEGQDGKRSHATTDVSARIWGSNWAKFKMERRGQERGRGGDAIVKIRLACISGVKSNPQKSEKKSSKKKGFERKAMAGG